MSKNATIDDYNDYIQSKNLTEYHRNLPFGDRGCFGWKEKVNNQRIKEMKLFALKAKIILPDNVKFNSEYSRIKEDICKNYNMSSDDVIANNFLSKFSSKQPRPKGDSIIAFGEGGERLICIQNRHATHIFMAVAYFTSGEHDNAYKKFIGDLQKRYCSLPEYYKTWGPLLGHGNNQSKRRL